MESKKRAASKKGRGTRTVREDTDTSSRASPIGTCAACREWTPNLIYPDAPEPGWCQNDLSTVGPDDTCAEYHQREDAAR